MKPRSIVFLGILAAIVMFFIGLNLGKSIERYNETNPAPTPTVAQELLPTPQLTPYQMTQFEEYSFEECGVSFLSPSHLNESSLVSSDELELTADGESIFITCDQSYIQSIAEKTDAEVATASATIDDFDVTTFSSDTSVYWVMRNAARQQVLIDVSSNLYPLVSETLVVE